MGMREKLIELIETASFTCPDGISGCKDCEYYEKDSFGNPCNERKLLADLLIANGVTIPVRCKDCGYYREEELFCVGVSCVGDSHANWYPDDYCSYGERRTDA